LEVQRIHPDFESLDQQKPTPWGFWPTIGFSCIIAIACFVFGIILAVIFIIVSKSRNPEIDIVKLAQSLDSHGLFLAMITCITTPTTVGLVILFAKIRKNITIEEYLGLYKPEWRDFCKWSLILLLFIGCLEALSFALTFVGRPIVSEFMIDAYTTAHYRPLLLFAVIIAAPVAEEIFFRGFLFKGFENSKIGPIGAVIMTSLVWAAIHTQYDAYAVVGTFAGGLLLGWARLKVKSIYIPITMHVLWNLIATVEVVVYLKLI